MRVFVTGGTGLVGQRLVRSLAARADEVILLTRDRRKAEETTAGLAEPQVTIVKGDPATVGIWRESVAGCDAVVNLAGESIFAERWDDEQKERIRHSRLAGTRNVVAAIGLAPPAERPRTIVNASAIGYYGAAAPGDDRVLGESAHPGSDFLSSVCVAWEEAARGASAHGTRVAVLRLGVVLAPDGGALAQMVPAFRMFLGGPIGAGEQWFSWIHVDDVVGLILFTLDTSSLRGPLNATGPAPLRMKEFAKDLGAVLGRPSWFKVPRFALRLRFGEVADVIAASQRVFPAAAEGAGYRFKFATARAALADLLGAPAQLRRADAK